MIRKQTRGRLELTMQTYDQLSRYMKTMNGDRYYTSLPVQRGTEDVWITETGERMPICF